MRSCRFAIVLLALPAISFAQDRPQLPATVETSGFGERHVAPDRATVMLTVESKAQSAAVAATANAKSTQSVRDTLRAIGLDTAVSVSSYNVGADYEPGPRGESHLTGYVARTSIRVRLARTDMVGRVIDAGLAKGGTGVSVGFEASTAEAVRRDAIADASAKARLDAEALAKALGGSLGPLLGASTTGALQPMLLSDIAVAQRRAIATGEIVPNDIVIRAQVMTRWLFVSRP
jgi:uncharacterized protein YggE